MRAAITDRTRLIIVCDPNNPTGMTIGADELTAFLDAAPADITVVIDEAYVHFNERADSPSGIAYFRRYPNVAVAHTFSKAYGLAGLRIAYALAPERLANALRKVAIPFGVTDLPQAAAVASLNAEDELSARVAGLANERKRVVDAFRDAGIGIAETQANFIWVPCGDATTAAAALLEGHGLLVRPFVGEASV